MSSKPSSSSVAGCGMMLVHTMTMPIEDITTIFHDVEPIYQDDNGKVCTVMYPSAFKIAYSYIRAVWERKEYSERALRLSGTCVKLNPANYTAWHFRRECLKRLDGYKTNSAAVQQELDLAAALGGSNPKNYQVWYHRRALLESCGVGDFAETELDYIALVLEEDAKNYHAWSYRQWIVQSVDTPVIWSNEVQFASKLIKQDARNNSAWNQRWFAVHQGTVGPIDVDTARTEADFALEFGAILDPYNESPMRYLIAILREQHRRQHGDYTSHSKQMMRFLTDYEEKISSLRNVLDNAGRTPDNCFNLTAAHTDVLEMIGDAESLQKALKLVKDLATTQDSIRQKYWQARRIQVQLLL